MQGKLLMSLTIMVILLVKEVPQAQQFDIPLAVDHDPKAAELPYIECKV